jgi:hypothetical protein
MVNDTAIEGQDMSFTIGKKSWWCVESAEGMGTENFVW